MLSTVVCPSTIPPLLLPSWSEFIIPPVRIDISHSSIWEEFRGRQCKNTGGSRFSPANYSQINISLIYRYLYYADMPVADCQSNKDRSTLAMASATVSSSILAYTALVILVEECPNTLLMISISTPLFSSMVAPV